MGMTCRRPHRVTLRSLLQAPARASQIHGRHAVLERADWEARGAGYRGPHLGG